MHALLPTHRQPERIGPWFQSITSLASNLTRKPLFRWIVTAIVVVGVLWFFVLPSVFLGDGYLGSPFYGFGPPPAEYPPIHPYPPPKPPILEPLLEPELDPPNLPIPDPELGPPGPPSSRAIAVRDAFLHAYNGYTQYASGFDELRPVSGGKANTFNGWLVTLVDALDTLWIMDLHDEFYDAIPAIDKMSFLTETVIRVLGGLLSAHALSGEPVLLSRADDLGKALLPIFNTSSGLPTYSVNTATGETRHGWTIDLLWSEMTTCQLEYKYLAHLTGEADYFTRVEHVMDVMHNFPAKNGLYPTIWSLKEARPANEKYSVGAFADSGYEYLLKQYLLTAKSEPKFLEMYLESAQGIIENLLYLSPNRQLLYVTDTDRGTPSHAFEHLSCFFPGVLALGAKTLDIPPSDRELHEWAARGLAYTCYIAYADQPSGLGPDIMAMDAWRGADPKRAGRWIDHVKDWIKSGRPGGVPPGLHEPSPAKGSSGRDYRITRDDYLLRPETVESLYLMWRTTGDERWRERGWEIFQSIDKHTRTKYGYASVHGVSNKPTMVNEMPSYFLAETLKYLYLLFLDEEVISLDKWVFNTEAHPLPVFEWTAREKTQYKIPS
ncbi:glycoside hydrolase family 47 protein [Scleroderma citrinum]